MNSEAIAKIVVFKSTPGNSVLWSSQTSKLDDLFQNVCEYFEIYRNKHANKQTSTQAHQRVSNQRNTNPDICNLQCRLFFFWTDAGAAAIVWGLLSRASVI